MPYSLSIGNKPYDFYKNILILQKTLRCNVIWFQYMVMYDIRMEKEHTFIPDPTSEVGTLIELLPPKLATWGDAFYDAFLQEMEQIERWKALQLVDLIIEELRKREKSPNTQRLPLIMLKKVSEPFKNDSIIKEIISLFGDLYEKLIKFLLKESQSKKNTPKQKEDIQQLILDICSRFQDNAEIQRIQTSILHFQKK